MAVYVGFDPSMLSPFISYMNNQNRLAYDRSRDTKEREARRYEVDLQQQQRERESLRQHEYNQGVLAGQKEGRELEMQRFWENQRFAREKYDREQARIDEKYDRLEAHEQWGVYTSRLEQLEAEAIELQKAGVSDDSPEARDLNRRTAMLINSAPAADRRALASSYLPNGTNLPDDADIQAVYGDDGRLQYQYQGTGPDGNPLAITLPVEDEYRTAGWGLRNAQGLANNAGHFTNIEAAEGLATIYQSEQARLAAESAPGAQGGQTPEEFLGVTSQVDYSNPQNADWNENWGDFVVGGLVGDAAQRRQERDNYVEATQLASQANNPNNTFYNSSRAPTSLADPQTAALYSYYANRRGTELSGGVGPEGYRTLERRALLDAGTAQDLTEGAAAGHILSTNTGERGLQNRAIQERASLIDTQRNGIPVYAKDPVTGETRVIGRRSATGEEFMQADWQARTESAAADALSAFPGMKRQDQKGYNKSFEKYGIANDNGDNADPAKLQQRVFADMRDMFNTDRATYDQVMAELGAPPGTPLSDLTPEQYRALYTSFYHMYGTKRDRGSLFRWLRKTARNITTPNRTNRPGSEEIVTSLRDGGFAR